MATRRYRNNKNKKVGKKRVGRTRKHRSSRRMRGGMNCNMDIEKRMCIYPFEKDKFYVDNDNNEYKFIKSEVKFPKDNASISVEVYTFTDKNGRTITKENNNANDQKFLNNLNPINLNPTDF